MQRRVIDAAGFEALFQKKIDPWNYSASPFEAFKRRALLRACGVRCRGRALELACATGETSRSLASRCLRLLSVDSSATALAAAARRTQGHRNITLRQALLPGEMPRGPFDLIVVSELLYYLRAERLARPDREAPRGAGAGRAGGPAPPHGRFRRRRPAPPACPAGDDQGPSSPYAAGAPDQCRTFPGGGAGAARASPHRERVGFHGWPTTALSFTRGSGLNGAERTRRRCKRPAKGWHRPTTRPAPLIRAYASRIAN